ncbi:helix-turn-helix domain-containing protein [Rhizobium straminoryzae]|uniref:helix-turn-helix domain-containing protein n=1 Tax=Rhizobium straminoryzae TaxID=1387186 RepID=UPI001FE746A1|nr:helix-turn-helix transcriptional regulator [Rhizobium straminoryzae]
MYRKEGFDGIVSFGEIDANLSAFLLDERAKTGLTQSDFATLAGLARVVYSRYELNISRLTVSRMIHLSELLGFLPMQMIHAAAPHLYGKNPEEADDRVELFRLIHDLPHDTIRSLIGIVGQLTPKDVLEARQKAEAEAEAKAEAERQRLTRKAARVSRKGRPPGRPPGRKTSKVDTPTDD